MEIIMGIALHIRNPNAFWKFLENQGMFAVEWILCHLERAQNCRKRDCIRFITSHHITYHITYHVPASVGVRYILAPSARSVYTFSFDIFSGKVITILYPLMAAVRANPIPVFPDVGSIKVSPGLMRPDFSAFSIEVLAFGHNLALNRIVTFVADVVDAYHRCESNVLQHRIVDFGDWTLYSFCNSRFVMMRGFLFDSHVIWAFGSRGGGEIETVALRLGSHVRHSLKRWRFER